MNSNSRGEVRGRLRDPLRNDSVVSREDYYGTARYIYVLRFLGTRDPHDQVLEISERVFRF